MSTGVDMEEARKVWHGVVSLAAVQPHATSRCVLCQDEPLPVTSTSTGQAPQPGVTT